MGGKYLHSDWIAIDDLWQSYIENRSTVSTPHSPSLLADNFGLDDWMDLDIWWETYISQQYGSVTELHELLSDLASVWDNSESRFDYDPLTVNWRSDTAANGPLRANQEENWSQWLSFLIHSNSGDFLKQLFGKEVGERPESVQREVYFFDPSRRDRRVDILIEFDTVGISIEVKLDDEIYEKTPHTAELVERDDSRKWTHVLLLPKTKRPQLRATFSSQLDESGDRPSIHSAHSTNISVVYWRDISQALRRTLLTCNNLAPHWEASAYLFITLIEQKILNFRPSLDEESQIHEADPFRTPDLWAISTVDVDEQVHYLRKTLTEIAHE